MASAATMSSHQQLEEFAPSTSTSGGSTMLVKELRYDVFISHFKHPLGRVIYKELEALGLKVFLNSKELELGDQEVEVAIKTAWLYFPVFSEDYAQSSRCLEELSVIRRRKGAKIVPIFCHVKPDDVRYVKGVYAAAFDPNKVGHSSEKLLDWKEALYSVSHHIGHVVENKEDESMLLKKIPDWIAKDGTKLPLVVEEFTSADTNSSIQPQVEEFAPSISTSGGSTMPEDNHRVFCVDNEKGLSGPKAFMDHFQTRVKVAKKAFLDHLRRVEVKRKTSQDDLQGVEVSGKPFLDDLGGVKGLRKGVLSYGRRRVDHFLYLDLHFSCMKLQDELFLEMLSNWSLDGLQTRVEIERKPFLDRLLLQRRVKAERESFRDVYSKLRKIELSDGYCLIGVSNGHTIEQLWEQLWDWDSAINDLQHVIGICAPAHDQYSFKKMQEWKKALYNVSHDVGPKEDEDMLMRDLCYDVFINHRGPDVKHTLAKAIYKNLKEMGLKVFLDSEELRWGDHVPSVLEKVMKSAKLHLAIFSQNYAQSKWCLRELSFMRSKTCAEIIPIFYHCKLKDVRYTKGVFAHAFEQHKRKRRFTSEQLQKWKETLFRASWNLGPILNSKEDEDMLLKNISYVCKEFVNVKTKRRLKNSHHRWNSIRNLALLLFKF